MDISYNHNNKIYRYIEAVINSSPRFKFNRKNVISINKFKRFDIGLQILTGLQNVQNSVDLSNIQINEKLLSMYDQCDKKYLLRQIVNDERKLFRGFSVKENRLIYEMIDEYECVRKFGFIRTIEWIFHNYSMIIDCIHTQSKIDTIKQIIVPFYVLGSLEWFHITIIINNVNANYDSNFTSLILCDIYDIETDLLVDYTIDDLKDFLKNEYCSHSVVFIIDNVNLYVYDSDRSDEIEDDNSLMNAYNRLTYMLDRTNRSLDIVLKDPVQTLTNDNYCIFHCIEFMMKLSMTNTFDIIEFMHFIEAHNKHKTIKKIHKFIMRLNKKANLFIG